MRKIRNIVFLAVCGLAFSFTFFQKFPEAKITNGIIHARIYLPDPDSGYYRSTRFDWSGVIPDIEYKGHTFCGQWFDKYDPTINDAIMGPVESFAPLGYDEVKADGHFTQIGVGLLARPDDKIYSPFRYYKILNTGEWSIKKEPDKVEFSQKLDKGEYPYEYKKTVQLVKGKPEMDLIHSLKNTGHRIIETEVYDHNLFLIDSQSVGPDCVIKFPFNILVEKQGSRGIDSIAKIENKEITFPKRVTKGEQAFAVLYGYDNSSKDYDIRIENHKTGAGVNITCDRPLSKLVFWASATTFCPEPYIHIKIKPGEVFNWKIKYLFYVR